LTTAPVIRRAIARGIQEGAFGYVGGAAPEIADDGTYQVSIDKVRFGVGLAEDEIDLETGFLMMPSAVPRPAPAPVAEPTVVPAAGQTPPEAGTVAEGPPASGISPLPPPGAPPQKVVEIAFSADRNQLFSAWNAVANLADLAGKVSVRVSAESAGGFDRAKLQNGVIEPLQEADLIE
jgi:hypothetical protein